MSPSVAYHLSMIRNTLKTVAGRYLDAKVEQFKGHPLATFLRNEAIREITDVVSDTNLFYKGSAGQSKWAEVPWIGAFDPIVTSSARRGYYVAYLFAADMGRVYLSLTLGITDIRKEFGRHTKDELKRRAELVRLRLADLPHDFSIHDIELSGNSQRPQDYEWGTALHIEYQVAALPDEYQLQIDLRTAIELYFKLTARGGVGTFENDESIGSVTESIIEKRQYRYHRKIERNWKAGKAAKNIHGYQCQICGFDFEERFGEIGKQYIEAHHLTPLSELPEGQAISLDATNDFAVLCSNCHRMIHRRNAPKTVDGLRSLLKNLSST